MQLRAVEEIDCTKQRSDDEREIIGMVAAGKVNKPIVLRSFAKEWFSVRQWSLEYFSRDNVMGDSVVMVSETNEEVERTVKRTSTMREYAQALNVRNNDRTKAARNTKQAALGYIKQADWFTSCPKLRQHVHFEQLFGTAAYSNCCECAGWCTWLRLCVELCSNGCHTINLVAAFCIFLAILISSTHVLVAESWQWQLWVGACVLGGALVRRTLQSTSTSSKSATSGGIGSKTSKCYSYYD